jgi:(R,R)-butanediol dehydrogenase/meso-butanediol dehydrogenase/diacetyl reductase
MIGPEYIFYKIPDPVSYEFGALAEPIGNAFQMVRRGQVKLGDKVAILGAGPIGLGVLIGAKLSGASKVYVVELARKRGEIALALGADEYIDPKNTDPQERILELTNGLGVDVSFDCVGHADTPPIAIEFTRKRGTTVVIGVMAKPTQFDFTRISTQDKIVVASWGYFREAPLALELMASGRIDPSVFITGVVELKDAVEKAFKELIRNPEANLKILLRPPGS